MKAKDLAAFLMQYPDADVVMDDSNTEYLYALCVCDVWNDGEVISLRWDEEDPNYIYDNASDPDRLELMESME